MKTLQFICLFVFTFHVSLMQAQTIDKNQSVVEFKIKGAAIFNVKGTFKGMKGDFNFNKSDLKNSSFDICIDASSIDTGNNKRDTHLQTEDFFHVKKYPQICFQSNSVSQKGKDYLATGELTMHGVTKIIDISFTFSNNTFKSTFEIERLDYKIGEDTGTLTVGSTANVTIICVVK